MLHGEELPLVVHVVAREQPTQHLDGLLQHPAPHSRARPGVTGDVLVEPLTDPEAEHEAAVRHRGDGRRGVREGDRVHAPAVERTRRWRG